MDHNRLRIVLAGAVILIVGHGATLYYISSHLPISVTVVAVVIGLVVVEHLELLGPLYTVARKTRWHSGGIKAIPSLALIGALVIALVALHLTGHYPRH